MKQNKKISMFAPELVLPAFRQSFIKLDPRLMFRNPVMFTVEIGTLVMFFVSIYSYSTQDPTIGRFGYNVAIFFVLFITLLFANFAEALAEARGKAQAESLRKTREETPAKKVNSADDTHSDKVQLIPSSKLVLHDLFVCEAGDIIPMDGEIVSGIATIDESAITGESAPVIREAGGDKSSVTGGTKVLSGRISPEGKSIVELAKSKGVSKVKEAGMEFIKFTAETRSSGVNTANLKIRKGAFDSIKHMVSQDNNYIPEQTTDRVKLIAQNGGTPLVVAVNNEIKGVIELQDIIKPGIQERFKRLRKMGVKTVMVTGDNPLTAKYIAEKAGVDDFIAEAKPEDKMNYIKAEQNNGKLVAMMGDGTNDAPALAQADVGVAMNSGTQAAKEAGNMVDLDNDPTKLIEVVEIGKQLLITRGTITTFSIANDVAKYFAIVPALFITSIPALRAMNIMHLASPETAILSAVIFNAIIIPLLIPLSLRGVAYRPIGASALLRRNLLIYGAGGIVVPFIGIKIIDLALGLFM